MEKKTKALIIGLSVACALLVVGLIGFFIYQHNYQKKQAEQNASLEQLAALDKQEMENEYAQFALQYDELKNSVKNDSLLTQLEKEQKRAEDLLQELRSVKSNDAREIARLKRELATVRQVLRTYIRQVDSLQRLNQTLTNERDAARAQYNEATMQISGLNAEKQSLSEKVAVAAQLDATGISISPLKKNGKAAKKTKDINRFAISFSITRNVTAKTGNRTIYVRLTKPGNEVVNASGSFNYENRSLTCSAQKTIEYTGQETRVTVYVPVNEYLSAGTYNAYIFTDGQMIGSGSMSMKK